MMKHRSYALIGASNNPEKYGHKIFVNLTKKWYTVYPVNPKESQIDGYTCYPILSAIPYDIDIIIFVTPPSVTLSLLSTIQTSSTVWFQPWASDNICITYCKKHNLSYIADACIMVQSR